MVDYREWISKAMEFLEVCREDFSKGRYWLACFHAQQAVELYLKGVLVLKSGSYPFTHSLVELLETLESMGYEIPDNIFTMAEALERHYTRARYPGAGLAVYNERVASRCISYAEKIIGYIKEILHV